MCASHANCSYYTFHMDTSVCYGLTGDAAGNEDDDRDLSYRGPKECSEGQQIFSCQFFYRASYYDWQWPTVL